MNPLISLLKNTAPLLASALGGPAAIGLGVLSWVAGKVTGDPTASAETVASHLLSNTAKQQELEMAYKMEVLKMTSAEIQAQLEINKEEAKSDNIWKSGARPGFLWLTVLIFLNNFIIAPYCEAFGLHVPTLNIDAVLAISLPLLGISGMRTYEKVHKGK